MVVVGVAPAELKVCHECRQEHSGGGYRCEACNERRRAVRASRRALGVCVDCRVPVAEPGQVRCSRCAQRRRVRDAQYKRGIPVEEHWRHRLDPDSDPAPAIKLRQRLQEMRVAGASFAEAWREAVAYAVGELGPETTWTEAFSGTRRAWANAYLGIGRPLKLTADLLVDEGEHFVDVSLG
jgi:hypothetical protein